MRNWICIFEKKEVYQRLNKSRPVRFSYVCGWSRGLRHGVYGDIRWEGRSGLHDANAPAEKFTVLLSDRLVRFCDRFTKRVKNDENDNISIAAFIIFTLCLHCRRTLFWEWTRPSSSCSPLQLSPSFKTWNYQVVILNCALELMNTILLMPLSLDIYFTVVDSIHWTYG